MKFFIKLWLCVILMSIANKSWAQGFVENALLFSRTKPGGSARVQAMGGSQVALGGDFSSSLSNPAGLGMYNRSEFTFSPAINTYNTDSEHLGTRSSDSKNVFNIPGLSYVRHLPQDKNGFLGGSFGVSMTRVNDFNSAFQYKGSDNVSSIVDYFIENATGLTTDNIDGRDIRTALGYDNYLLEDSSFYGGSNTEYFSVMGTDPDDPSDIRELTRHSTTEIKGAQYQWSFAYGGNFQDKLFFGANIGLTTLRYKFRSSYSESDFSFDLHSSPVDSLSLEETIEIDGSGINLTLGLIYRPVNFFQIGVSFVTPTYYELTDSYFTRVSTIWNSYDYPGPTGVLNLTSSEITEPIISEYRFNTPSKFSTGVAFFLGKYGVIASDVEFVNYNKAKYKSSTPDVSFDAENDDIKYYYTNVINYRFGTELRYSVFRLRGGYTIQTNPYKDAFNVDRKITTVSLGAGVRLNKFFIDAAWLMSKSDGTYSPFVFENGTGPVAALSNKVTSAMVTVGFTF